MYEVESLRYLQKLSIYLHIYSQWSNCLLIVVHFYVQNPRFKRLSNVLSIFLVISFD